MGLDYVESRLTARDTSTKRHSLDRLPLLPKRESAEDISARGGELVAADKLTIASNLLFDLVVVEDRRSDMICSADSPCTNESEWS